MVSENNNVIVRTLEYVKDNLQDLLNVKIQITSTTLQDIQNYEYILEPNTIVNIFSYKNSKFFLILKQ